MYGNVVVIADGVNSMLAEKAGFRKPVTPEQMAVGAKDVYELSPELIRNDSANPRAKVLLGYLWAM